MNKPPGIVTQPDLTEMGKAFIKHKYKKPGAVFLHPVHRLDRVVSGLVLFARTSKALSRLQEMMREKKIKKKYHALIDGKLPQAEGKLVHYLDHGSFQAHLCEKGKEAILLYRALGQKKGGIYVEIDLITGRYHQIRAQFSAIDCPIRGDAKYGSQKPWPLGIALHHSELSFEHPVTHEIVVFNRQAPL